MGIAVQTNFDVLAALPVDSRLVRSTLSEVRAIPMQFRYLGLQVFVYDPNQLGWYGWFNGLGDDDLERVPVMSSAGVIDGGTALTTF